MINQIQKNLIRFKRIESNNSKLRSASVLILIIPNQNNDLSILLTRRSANLNRNAGQYALPGGKSELYESKVQTALRECNEEIGLHLNETNIIGTLDDFETCSGFSITPHVALVRYQIVLETNPEEVDEVFFIPLEELIFAASFKNQEQNKIEDNIGFSLILPSIGHEIFAPTAAILFQFYEVAICNRMTRVSNLKQPAFTWN